MIDGNIERSIRLYREVWSRTSLTYEWIHRLDESMRAGE